MTSFHFWTEAPKSFIAPTYFRVEAIKLSGRVIGKYIEYFLTIILIIILTDNITIILIISNLIIYLAIKIINNIFLIIIIKIIKIQIFK